MWWRRTVLPSLPWVVCFLSFFFQNTLGGWQRRRDGECTQVVICRGGAAAREFYANECVLRTFLRIPNRLQDRVRRRRTVFDVVERNFGMAVKPVSPGIHTVTPNP